MSFLSELTKQKSKLKGAETVVTKIDGQRFIENKDDTITNLQSTYGFVVDDKPDDIPVLITDYLYIGSQDCAVESVIQKFSIKHVLSLGIDVTVEVDHKFVECLDLPETVLKPTLKVALPFLREAIDAKENVLVHCNAGVSRTSTVAIAYLMHYEGMNYDDAYNLVKTKRPAIRPNDGFSIQLKDMKPRQVI